MIEEHNQPVQHAGWQLSSKRWRYGNAAFADTPNCPVVVGLILWRRCCPTSGPSLDQSIDHAAACGLFQLGKEFRRALQHCNQALQDNPGDHSSLLNRGSAHLTLGNLDEALSEFDRAIEMKPEDPRNYFNRALVHGAKKDHRRAIADYSEAIRIIAEPCCCLQ